MTEAIHDLAPSACGWHALRLPLLRFSAFLRSAAMTLSCWIVALALILLTRALFTRVENVSILMLFAQFFFLAGIFGLRTFTINWSRVAFAWPETPKSIPFWVRQKSSLHRLFPSLSDPVGLLRQTAVAVPAILAASAATVGLFWIHPALGFVGLYSLPIFPFALLISFGWPRRSSMAVDEEPIRGTEARALAKGTLRFRLITYLCACTPTWWIGVSLFVLPMQSPAARPVMPYLVLSTLLPFLTLGAAWISGAGSLLYARLRKSSTAAIFD